MSTLVQQVKLVTLESIIGEIKEFNQEGVLIYRPVMILNNEEGILTLYDWEPYSPQELFFIPKEHLIYDPINLHDDLVEDYLKWTAGKTAFLKGENKKSNIIVPDSDIQIVH